MFNSLWCIGTNKFWGVYLEQAGYALAYAVRHTPILLQFGNDLHYLSSTPLPALTFEAPKLAIATSTPSVPLVPPSEELEARRHKRYSLAEGALATTLQHCNSEPPPEVLQIRALEKATTMLSAYAQDAKDRAAHLRALLADPATDPEAFELMKRERWMEEKRQLAADEEYKILRRQLQDLNESLKQGKSNLVTRDTARVDPDTKRHTNLIKFLGASQGRALIYTKRPASTYIQRSPRRMTVDDVLPMRLRTYSVTAAFSDSIRGHSRSISLDGQQSENVDKKPRLDAVQTSSAEQRNRPSGVPNQPSLDVVREDPVSVSGQQSPTTSSPPSVPSTTSSGLRSRLHSASGSSDVPSTLGSFDDERYQGDSSGTATIFHTILPQPDKVELVDLDVTLPGYALDLFTDFDRPSAVPFQTTFPALTSRHSTTSLRPPVTPPPSARKSILSMDSPHVSALSPSFLSPHPTPTKPKSKPSLLHKSSSHRQLGSLFAIPEAVASRFAVLDPVSNLGGDSNNKAEFSPVGFFARLGGDSSTPCSSTASLSAPSTDHHGTASEGITSRLKRRISALKRH